MDDPRIEWLRDQAYLALDLKEPQIFEDMLDRDEGDAERLILKFLNETPEDHEDALLFYKTMEEEEEEVEVECGKYIRFWSDLTRSSTSTHFMKLYEYVGYIPRRQKIRL